MALGSDIKLGAAVETLGTVKGTSGDIKLGAAVETLGTVKGAAALGSDIKLGAAVETLGTVKGTAGDIKLGAAVETLGSVVIDSNEPDAWEVVVNKGTEYVLPDAPDILLI